MCLIQLIVLYTIWRHQPANYAAGYFGGNAPFAKRSQKALGKSMKTTGAICWHLALSQLGSAKLKPM